MIQDPLLLLAFMLTVVAFARWLEERYEFVKKISSAVVCTLLGIVLANLGVIGHTGPCTTPCSRSRFRTPSCS